MKLFSRRVTLAGTPADYGPFATQVAQHVSTATGRELALWGVVLGAPRGTMMFTARVEGVADWQEMSAPLMADAGYLALIAANQHLLTGVVEDQLLQGIGSDIPDESPPIGAFATLTTTMVANGAYADAMAWGVDMAELATAVTGMPVRFVMNHYGPFGAVGWIGVGPDAASVDQSTAALDADAEYLKMLGRAGDLFAEGSGHRMLATRLA